MTEGNTDGNPEVNQDARADDGQTERHEVAHHVAETAPKQEAPMFNTQALDFSRDGDHPEKPDQFEPAPKPKPAEAPKPQEPKTEAEAPKPRRADPVASAPVLERVVVSMDGTPATAPAASAEDKPVRKGWWQRKLAGE
jgi:hypothetical protein